jgi:hypothetical protein
LGQGVLDRRGLRLSNGLGPSLNGVLGEALEDDKQA